MRKIKVIIALLTFFSVATAKGQYYDDGPVLSFNGDIAFATSKPLSSTHYPGVGGTLKLALPVSDYGDVVFSGSIMSFYGKKQQQVNGKQVNYKSRNIATAMVGYRQYISPLALYNTWYIEPRAGVTLDGTKYRPLTYGVGLGYLVNNKIDISARYQGNSRFSFFGLSLGYGITLN